MVFSVDALPGGLSAETFLRDYWQKKPLLIRQAFPDYENPITPDELAGLSLEEEVEARIVLEQGATPWELRRGPFTDADYQSLPERDWTLLVQAVDQFVPEVADLLSAFHFLPSWRLDDVMISYAVPGGSVGPHYDSYDVFLLQVEGHRRWKIGQQCNDESPLLEHDELRILKDFHQQDEWVLAPGDMLYLPPGLAHYGVAEDNCMTYSVGFRAPSHNEILSHFTDFIGQHLSASQRYRDSDMPRLDDPALIDEQTISRLQALVLELVTDEEALGNWFGRFMTEPRYPELISGQEVDEETLAEYLEQGFGLLCNPSSRLAWREEPGKYLALFASGEHSAVSLHLRPFVQMLCNHSYLEADQIRPWQQDAEAMRLLVQLMGQGDLLFETDDE